MEETKKPAIRFDGYTEDWEKRKLSDIAKRVTRKNTELQSTLPLTISSQYGLVDQITYFNNRIASQNIRGYYLIKNGEFAYNKSSSDGFPFGTVKRLDRYDMGVLSTLYIIFALKDNSVSSQFLVSYYDTDYWHKQVSERAAEGARNHGLLNISADDFLDTELLVPSEVEEQDAIASYLKILDNLITNAQQKCDKLLTFKKSMLEKLFPQNGAKEPEMRFAGFAGEWEPHSLKEIVKEINRNDPTSDAPIMMITASNGFIEQSDRYSFDNAGDSLKKYILLKKGELAYNHGASKLRPYGSCFALTKRDEARIPFVYHCFSTVGNNPEFLSLELNGADVESQLRKIVSSGARMDGLLNISFEEYTSVSILLPKEEEQNKIADFFRAIEELVSLYGTELEKLKNIKSTLLEKMFV